MRTDRLLSTHDWLFLLGILKKNPLFIISDNSTQTWLSFVLCESNFTSAILLFHFTLAHLMFSSAVILWLFPIFCKCWESACWLTLDCSVSFSRACDESLFNYSSNFASSPFFSFSAVLLEIITFAIPKTFFSRIFWLSIWFIKYTFHSNTLER